MSGDNGFREGWIRLYRKSIQSRVFQNEGLWKVWTWCLMKANHSDQWITVKTGRGTTEIQVKRGEFVFGRKSAAKELQMVDRTVHKRILKLKNMENLDIKSDTHWSIVTILNYDAYQSIGIKEVTSKVTGKGHPSDTNNNENSDQNEKKKFLYPRFPRRERPYKLHVDKDGHEVVEFF